jgi:hypothetical protein
MPILAAAISARDQLGCLAAARQVTISQRDDFSTGQCFVFQDPARPAAETDEADLDTIIWPRVPRTTKNLSWHKERKAKRSGKAHSLAKKFTSLDGMRGHSGHTLGRQIDRLDHKPYCTSMAR